MANQIIINGQNYSGRNITVNNGKISIDGDKVYIEDEKDIRIYVTGDVEQLNSGSADVEIIGDVLNSVKTSSGDVKVHGDVSGSVTTMSGDVESGPIKGSVKTMSGDIRSK